MLIAGAVTSLTVYFKDLGLKTMLIALLASFVTFYLIGTIIKMVFDSWDKKNEDSVSDEGEVIEKESDGVTLAEGEAGGERPENTQ